MTLRALLVYDGNPSVDKLLVRIITGGALSSPLIEDSKGSPYLLLSWVRVNLSV